MHMLTTMTRVLLLLCYYFATELIDCDHQLFANSDTTLKMVLNNKHMIVLHDCDTKVCFE